MKNAEEQSWFCLTKPSLQRVIDLLRGQGFRVIGPTVADGAIVFREIESINQLPIGIWDEQDGGRYRLVDAPTQAWFEYVVGPHSLKNYMFPPRQTVLEGQRNDQGDWQFREPQDDSAPIAILGARACDLAALAIQDRIFMSDAYCDPNYAARRSRLLVIAVNCQRSAATCFCHSMNCGPAVSHGFDLALTEVDDDFIVEVGSERGRELMQPLGLNPASPAQQTAARERVAALAHAMAENSGSRLTINATRSAPISGTPLPVLKNEPVNQRHLETDGIRDLLYSNLNHPRWEEVAERCLACGNCTMVCPTCFCSRVEDVPSLDETEVRRERVWASCFNEDHSYMNSGAVRQTTRSRYRQWLTHKLGGWIDQFGTSGCVGCGRCITWCPVGIDLTVEVAALRESAAPLLSSEKLGTST